MCKFVMRPRSLVSRPLTSVFVQAGGLYVWDWNGLDWNGPGARHLILAGSDPILPELPPRP